VAWLLPQICYNQSGMRRIKQLFVSTWKWARGIDWRVWAIVATIVVAILGTVAIYLSGYGRDPTTHFGAIFAAWVGGLVLFVIAGSVVAIVSLVRPETEPYDSRARILLKRQTGKHVDYIISKIRETLEHYSELTEITITIQNFHAGERKYRIASVNQSSVRSYLTDVETTYDSTMQLVDATSPPSGEAANRLVYTRVGGVNQGVSVDFTKSIVRPVRSQIDAGKNCHVSAMTEFWVNADTEENTHKVRRYTQTLTLNFENLLSDVRPVKIEYTLDGTKWGSLEIPHGGSNQIAVFQELKPDGSVVFNYRIMAP
jgi:hypothetical protein